MSTRTQRTVETRTARLNATVRRMENRQRAANAALAKAEAALVRAEQGLAKAKAKADAVARQANELIAKQQRALRDAETRHAAATAREQERVVKAANTKVKTAPGTVTTQDGGTLDLSADAVATVKAVIGRRRKGTLAVADAIPLCQAIDAFGICDETFTVRVKGRKTAIRFAVADDDAGLMFETIA